MKWLKVILLALWPVFPWAGTANVHPVIVLTVDEAIGPATSDFLHRSFMQAEEREASLIVIRLDTPGGLDAAMRDIIRDIIASAAPVAIYVAPSGARAASAGTYMLYAAHVAAMAPATNLGAATPVRIGGGFPDFTPDDEDRPGKDGKKKKDGKEKPASPDSAMEKKIINDAVAYIRGLAQMRGRNAEWAEKAVREGVSLSADEALAQHVIDLMADDLPKLLAAVEGRTVQVQGLARTIHVKGEPIETLEPDWRSRLLSVITDPNVAYILLLLGIYGLFFELASPGYVLPGVIGAICLLLALYAFQVLPVNYAGVALILVGIAFMVAEVFVSGLGALGIGGVIAFVIGSVILFDRDIGGFSISLPLIGGVALFSAAFFIGVATMALKLHRRPAVSGAEQMIGIVGEALEDFSGSGRVHAHGETWRAYSNAALKRGQKVKVTALQNLTLIVEPTKEET
jgi:membrane-bound serine protease (ClpP class)